MDLHTKSFESPISSPEEDLLSRWRLANDMYTIIRTTPKDWSCRIGIYGKWGEGKTSLLRLIETQARAEGLISFWVNPSQAENSDALWRTVIQALIEALTNENLLVEEVRSWRIRLLGEKSEPFDKLAEVNKYAKAIVGFGREAIKEWLRPDGEQIRKLRGKLHPKTIIVFVDDLDRADPKVVPALLLGLRDVLDIPGFCFLLAFDDEIVSETLSHINTAWGDGSAFLDKILDFSFLLPKANACQRLALVKHHIRELCPWMNIDVVEQNADLLPETPRRLKALLRNLMTLGPLVQRHTTSEIHWVDFLFGQLLRLESPTFVENFLSGGNDTLIEVGPYLPQTQNRPPFEDRVELAVEESGITDAALRSRVKALLSTWLERRGFGGTKNFGYYGSFGSVHRDITQREFDAFVQHYRESRDLEVLASQLDDHAAKVVTPRSLVAQEFLRLLVEFRGAYLTDAVGAEMEEDLKDYLEQAHQNLELLRAVFDNPPPLFRDVSSFFTTVIQSIAAQAFTWMGFRRSTYQASREEERVFLLSCAEKSFSSGMEWIECLTWDNTILREEEDRLAADMLREELLGSVRDRVQREALEMFEKEGAYREFNGSKSTNAGRFCFLNLKSPIWQESNRQQFFLVLEKAANCRAVRENAFELLKCLSWTRPAPGFGGDREEHEQILQLPGLAQALWRASTAQPVQYRFQQRLVEIRNNIAGICPDENQVPIPKWLAGRVAELDKSPSSERNSALDAS